jgi:hypothetical protein
LIKHLGIKSREWIAARLERGTMQSVKCQMDTMGLRARKDGGTYFHGLSLKLAKELFGDIPESSVIRTTAGPKNDMINFNFILVPWVVVYGLAKRAKASDEVLECLRVISKFQMRLYGTRSKIATVKAIAALARKK